MGTLSDNNGEPRGQLDRFSTNIASATVHFAPQDSVIREMVLRCNEDTAGVFYGSKSAGASRTCDRTLKAAGRITGLRSGIM